MKKKMSYELLAMDSVYSCKFILCLIRVMLGLFKKRENVRLLKHVENFRSLYEINSNLK